MSYASEVFADSPKAYWKLGEAPGSSMVDSSGNSHSGSYVGGVTLGGQVTPRGPAAVLDGTSGYGDVAATADTWTDANWTAEIWFYLAALPNTDVPKPILGLSFPGSGTINFLMGFNLNGPSTGNTNHLQGGLFNGGFKIATYSTPPSINAWHHLATVWDASVPGAILYLDGAQVAASGATGSGTATPASPQDVLVGRRWDTGSTDRYFAGRLQHAAYYQAKLTPARILAHYNAGIQTEPNKNTLAALTRASTR